MDPKTPPYSAGTPTRPTSQTWGTAPPPHCPSVICREIDDVISADLEALMVKCCCGKGHDMEGVGFGLGLSSPCPAGPLQAPGAGFGAAVSGAGWGGEGAPGLQGVLQDALLSSPLVLGGSFYFIFPPSLPVLWSHELFWRCPSLFPAFLQQNPLPAPFPPSHLLQGSGLNSPKCPSREAVPVHQIAVPTTLGTYLSPPR